jgi:hypothetical protein
MTMDFLARNWSLVIASVLGTAVFLFVAFRVFQDSSRGRLRTHVTQVRQREAAAAAARKAVDKAAAKLNQLRAKSESVKPLRVKEASGSLEDARALQKIADDQVLVARNLLRKLILEEYPPKHHQKLRDRYLGQEKPDTVPFKLEG